MDLYNRKRQLENVLENIEKTEVISQENKQEIVMFKDYLLSEGVSLSRTIRFMFDVKKYVQMLGKHVRDATIHDIKHIIAEMEQSDLAEETRNTEMIWNR